MNINPHYPGFGYLENNVRSFPKMPLCIKGSLLFKVCHVLLSRSSL